MLCDPTASEATEQNGEFSGGITVHFIRSDRFHRMRSRLDSQQRSCIKAMCGELWRNQIWQNADYPN
jgi:hypothetical protein